MQGKDQLLKILRQQPEPLFALLDAARDHLILARLMQGGEQYQSLYEGKKGETLAVAAPYLVRLPSRSPLLETLIREGWGNAWGVFLTSREPFAEVRQHLRRFLLVRTEEGKEFYFRFYDPRVLRIFLPTCTGEETLQFFGPIKSYLAEAKNSETLLRFTRGWQGTKKESVPLTAPGPVVAPSNRAELVP